jgi:hypothetical protein
MTLAVDADFAITRAATMYAVPCSCFSLFIVQVGNQTSQRCLSLAVLLVAAAVAAQDVKARNIAFTTARQRAKKHTLLFFIKLWHYQRLDCRLVCTTGCVVLHETEIGAIARII